MNPESALHIHAVSRRFGSVLALNDVSFSVQRGSIFGLLGPNGAGKTTLFSIIAGFLRAHAGHVMALGENVHNSATRLLNRISVLPQDALFQSNVPIGEQLLFFARLAGYSEEDARTAIAHVMQRVGLARDLGRHATHLSHGMSKRLGLAQAFLGRPELILLDEPTAGLDYENAHSIRQLILELQAQQSTILVSSHNLAEIQELCDHVAILDRGRLVSYGPVSQLINSTSHRLRFTVARELDESLLQELSRLPGMQDCQRSGQSSYSLCLDAGAWDNDLDAFLLRFHRLLTDAGIALQQLESGRSLQEHFLEVTRK